MTRNFPKAGNLNDEKMAYKKKEIFELAKEKIVKHRLFFMEDIIAVLPCGKTKFYEFFTPKANETNTLKELLESNRIATKISMRKKWSESDNASLQIALMKIICTDEEAHRLNGSSIKADLTSGGDKIMQGNASTTITVNIVKTLDYDDDDDDYSDTD
jgi:hypothetical protein